MADEENNVMFGNDAEEINNSSEKNQYFAAQSADKLASNCLEKSKSFYNILEANSYLDKLENNWYFYHGEQTGDYVGNGHEVGFTGEQGELVNLPVNHYRNIAQHMLNMITASRPVMEARAANTDYKSLSQTYLAGGILDYYMKQKGLENCIRTATEMSIFLGSGYVRMEWNATSGELYDFDPETGEKNYEGEIEFSNLSPFDVVFDGTKDSWTHEWLIVRTRQNKFNLAAKYPELKDKILSLSTTGDMSRYKFSTFSNDDSDDIDIYEFYHKKTEALPDGRYCMFASSDIVFLDLPLPYREIPIYRVSAGEYVGTPYAYAPMFDVYPIQESINSISSTMMTNHSAFGVQNLFVPRGSDIEINSLEGALNIIEGNIKPEPLMMMQSSPESYKLYDMWVQAAETISGVNSVTRGNPEASLKSGTALALVQSMSLQFISGLQHNYVKLIENLGTGLINILKDYAKTPKFIALVGKNNRSEVKEFTSDNIKDINRVIVSVGNPLATTVAGRVQMAEQMLQMGLIKNPQQYFQVINTGSLESMFESDMNELLLIKSENEVLMEGNEVLAEMLDEHKTHILEHRTVMAHPDLRRDPKLRAIVQQHIQQHIDFLRTVDPDLLALIGQQPLQNSGSPQGVPPPAAPGQPGSSAEVLQPPERLTPPQALLKGQGSDSGTMIPNPANPPPPFNDLPVLASEMVPQ